MNCTQERTTIEEKVLEALLCLKEKIQSLPKIEKGMQEPRTGHYIILNHSELNDSGEKEYGVKLVKKTTDGKKEELFVQYKYHDAYSGRVPAHIVLTGHNALIDSTHIKHIKRWQPEMFTCALEVAAFLSQYQPKKHTKDI